MSDQIMLGSKESTDKNPYLITEEPNKRNTAAFPHESSPLGEDEIYSATK